MLNKLIDAIKQRYQYSDERFLTCYHCINGLQELTLQHAVYHSECYKIVTNSTNLKRLAEKHSKTPAMCDATVECNQSAKNTIDQVAEKSLQSKTKPYNKKPVHYLSEGRRKTSQCRNKTNGRKNAKCCKRVK